MPNLRTTRRSRGLTQTQLADFLGVDKSLISPDLADLLGLHQTAISLWERGERVPRPQTAHRLELMFGVPLAAVVVTY